MVRKLTLLVLMISVFGCTTSLNVFHATVPPWSYGVSGPEAPGKLDSMAKEFQIPEEKALVYIVKPGPKALGFRLDVYLDGMNIGSVGRDQYILSSVEPGHHKLKTVGYEYYEKRTILETHVRLTGYRVSEIEFYGESGKLYFFKQIYSPGQGSNYDLFKLIQIPEAEGKSALLSRKLGKFNKYYREYINSKNSWKWRTKRRWVFRAITMYLQLSASIKKNRHTHPTDLTSVCYACLGLCFGR